MLLDALRQFLVCLEDADLKVRIFPVSPLYFPSISPTASLSYLPCISTKKP